MVENSQHVEDSQRFDRIQYFDHNQYEDQDYHKSAEPEVEDDHSLCKETAKNV